MPLTAHRLTFTLRALTPVELGEHQGASIRGALFHALRGMERTDWAGFCAQKHLASCADCMVAPSCPVAFLVSTLDPASDRGRDVPRPFVIDPPLGGRTRLDTDETLTFGLTLFARAVQLFPYVVLGLRAWEQIGLGKPVKSEGWRRGRLALVEAVATNPLSGDRQPVLRPGDALVHVPDIPVTHEQVLQAAARLPADRLTIDFVTPTRVVEDARLAHRPHFDSVFHRLWWRVAALAEQYAGQPPDEKEKYRLVGLARQVALLQDRTRWVELRSYSTRQGRATPISGFMGQATYEGDLKPFLPHLVWGQFTHVGKNAVKGDGWYTVRADLSARPEQRHANVTI